MKRKKRRICVLYILPSLRKVDLVACSTDFWTCEPASVKRSGRRCVCVSKFWIFEYCIVTEMTPKLDEWDYCGKSVRSRSLQRSSLLDCEFGA